MTEYWVSKKQYWCKYCSIFIRDDAPSKRHHEEGFKHKGNKERFINDLYRQGNQAKHAKAQEAIEIARIEAAAKASNAQDAGGSQTHGRPSVVLAHREAQAAAAAASSSVRGGRGSQTTDKFANYTSAADLGLAGMEAEKSNYEIEQELKGRAGEAGAWEEVKVGEPSGLYTGVDGDGDEQRGVNGYKRKLGEYAVHHDEEDHESFKIEHKAKRPVRDPYDDDDTDFKAAFKSLAKKRDESGADAPPIAPVGLKREEWTGKLELLPDLSMAKKFEGVNKAEEGSSRSGVQADEPAQTTAAPPIHTAPDNEAVREADEPAVDTKPDIKPEADTSVAGESTASSSLFKKRRPAPSSRKK